MLLALIVKRNCKKEIVELHSVVNEDVNGCNLFEKDKQSLGIKKEKPVEAEEIEPSGKIRICKNVTKLSGS